MRLPWKSASRPNCASDFTSRLPPSTKVIRLKSTRLWRASVHVVVLHSQIHLPLAHRVDAVLDRELHPAGLPGRCASAAPRRRRRRRGAQFDRVALRLAVAVDEGEGRGAVDVAERQHAGLAHLIQRLPTVRIPASAGRAAAELVDEPFHCFLIGDKARMSNPRFSLQRASGYGRSAQGHRIAVLRPRRAGTAQVAARATASSFALKAPVEQRVSTST